MLFRDDCPLFWPGAYAERPTVNTPVEGLMLAGDGIRIDLPVALMERAATTGGPPPTDCWRAGDQWHTLHTVPVQGRSPVLRRLATRERRAPI